ncbi:hypothetical protein DV737_g821, partial [Chaetothyriales sp. CBS 132003]
MLALSSTWMVLAAPTAAYLSATAATVALAAPLPDNPLHVALFPPHEAAEIDMLFVLNSSLDIFDIRARTKTLDQDLGLLHPIDERLAAYGWLTNTGIKFIIIVDMLGRPVEDDEPLPGGSKPVPGLRDAALKPAFSASKRFESELRRIGHAWYPGVTNL